MSKRLVIIDGVEQSFASLPIGSFFMLSTSEDAEYQKVAPYWVDGTKYNCYDVTDEKDGLNCWIAYFHGNTKITPIDKPCWM